MFGGVDALLEHPEHMNTLNTSGAETASAEPLVRAVFACARSRPSALHGTSSVGAAVLPGGGFCARSSRRILVLRRLR
jgi:hypothetical protein